jgi:hypothetical protein
LTLSKLNSKTKKDEEYLKKFHLRLFKKLSTESLKVDCFPLNNGVNLCKYLMIYKPKSNEWFKIQLHEHPKCPTFDYKQKESQ